MNNPHTLSMVVIPTVVCATLAASLLAGCGDPTAAEGPAPAPRRDARAYTFYDGGMQSRVERAVLTGGAEILRGETHPVVGGLPVIHERVEIGADGQLRYADVLVDAGSGRSVWVILDPARGIADFRGPGSTTLQVPTDAPWSYALPTPPTPIAAWVTLRAAGTAHSVRLVDLGAARSESVMRDQLVVRDGDRAFVVLDDSVVPTTGEFVGWSSPPAIAWRRLTCGTGSC